METKILKAVSRLREALFTDLESEIEGFAAEDCSYCPANVGEAYYWPCLSFAAAQALINLRTSRRVFFEPVDWFLYLIDGSVPPHPVATVAGLKRGYKKPHWIPIAICAKPRDRS